MVVRTFLQGELLSKKLGLELGRACPASTSVLRSREPRSKEQPAGGH